jgi:thioredoxin-like negative regulator of GroEL
MTVSLIGTGDTGHPLEDRVPTTGTWVTLFHGSACSLDEEVRTLAAGALGERHNLVDVDAESWTAAHFKVRVLPTFMLWRDGRPIRQVVGAVDHTMLTALLR